MTKDAMPCLPLKFFKVIVKPIFFPEICILLSYCSFKEQLRG